MSVFLCQFFRPSINPSVRRAPYLRNHTLSDHNFWYTSHDDISRRFFSFSFFLGGRGLLGQGKGEGVKGPQNGK